MLIVHVNDMQLFGTRDGCTEAIGIGICIEETRFVGLKLERDRVN